MYELKEHTYAFNRITRMHLTESHVYALKDHTYAFNRITRMHLTESHVYAFNRITPVCI